VSAFLQSDEIKASWNESKTMSENKDANGSPEQPQRIRPMTMPEEEHTPYVTVEQARMGSLANLGKSQNSSDNSGGNLEKVKDLLFGAQMRDYEKRFNRLEDRITKESANLRDETRKRLDALESYIQKEVEALAEGLKTEQTERDESVKELTQELKDLVKSLEKKIAQLDEQTGQKQRELRQQILDQSKALGDDMQHKHEEVLSVLNQEAQELRVDKTDRATLAALFTEMAMRLSNQFELPNDL
jgi:DNA anti-recombination protein RmuC